MRRGMSSTLRDGGVGLSAELPDVHTNARIATKNAISAHASQTAGKASNIQMFQRMFVFVACAFWAQMEALYMLCIVRKRMM